MMRFSYALRVAACIVVSKCPVRVTVVLSVSRATDHRFSYTTASKDMLVLLYTGFVDTVVAAGVTENPAHYANYTLRRS